MDHFKAPVQTQAPVGKPAHPKIHALTSARFFAALYVVLFHTHWGVTPNSTTDRVLALGNVAPYFFFLLSGYILATVYLQGGKSVAPRGFYVARFARIYPLYIVSVLADLPFVILGRAGKYGLAVATERVLVLLAASTVMQQMWLQTLVVINIPSWSLAIEAVFYLSFPLLGPWLWKLRGRTLEVIAVIAYVGGVFLSQRITSLQLIHPSGFDLISFMTTFALGILLARWQMLRVEDTGSRKPAWIGWTVLILTAICFAVVIYLNPWLASVNINPGFLLAPVYMAAIWILAATRILPVRLLEASWLVVLGEASYGLYLIQLPIGHLFQKIHLAGSPWNYPLYLTVCIGLSVLSFYYFETPARRWILSRFRTRPKETMEAASAAQ